MAAFGGRKTGIARPLLYFVGSSATNYRVDIPAAALAACTPDINVRATTLLLR